MPEPVKFDETDTRDAIALAQALMRGDSLGQRVIFANANHSRCWAAATGLLIGALGAAFPGDDQRVADFLQHCLAEPAGHWEHTDDPEAGT